MHSTTLAREAGLSREPLWIKLQASFSPAMLAEKKVGGGLRVSRELGSKVSNDAERRATPGCCNFQEIEKGHGAGYGRQHQQVAADVSNGGR